MFSKLRYLSVLAVAFHPALVSLVPTVSALPAQGQEKSKACTLNGINFPKPKTFSESAAFKQGLEGLSKALEKFGQEPNNNNTYSIQIFSTNENSLYEFHRTASVVANGKVGVKAADSNAIYRIGSVSKLITAFTFMVDIGDARWEDPITDYIPELAGRTGSVSEVAWDEITLGAIAEHATGMARDEWWTDITLTASKLASNPAMPALNPSNPPLCGPVPCNREGFFKSLTSQSNPVVSSYTTPVYSNNAFQLLGYAMANITGRSMKDMVETDIFARLEMTRSSYGTPAAPDNGVIPVDPLTSGWAIDAGDLTPTGGMFSSANDLTKLGTAILKSSLLKPHQTRRWMRPTAFTADYRLSTGRPWEIHRLQGENDRLIDVYIKDGNLLGYAATIGLIPEFDIGYAILAAGDTSLSTVQLTSNVVVAALIPTLEPSARAEAAESYAGTFSSGSTSITITTKDKEPGLIVTKWISNNTNVFEVLSLAERAQVETVRLYPTGIQTGNVQAFRGLAQVANSTALAEQEALPLHFGCGWFSVGGRRFGNVGLDDFVFNVDDEGKAVSLEPRAWNVVLKRS